MAQAGDYEVFGLSHREIECTDPVSSRKGVESFARPDIVVNCAAFVRVDEAEDRRGRGLTREQPGRPQCGAGSAQRSRLSVFTSALTTYLMAGRTRPISESDAPQPINIYGVSKLAGEYFVQQACPHWLVAANGKPIRKSWLQRERRKLRGNDISQSQSQRAFEIGRRYTNVAHLHPRRGAGFGKTSSGREL